MKFRHSRFRRGALKMRVFPIIVVMTLVCLYQSYWLIGQYKEIENRLHDNIQEALRSSDFEEMAHRVDEISRMRYKGRVDVKMGYDHKNKKSLVKSEVTDSTTESPKAVDQPGNHTSVSPSSFGSVLKHQEDLLKVGLNMQRGIHSALDGIKEIDLNYLDDILTKKLLELGLDGDHQLLYLRKKPTDINAKSNDNDTIERLGSNNFQPNGVFRLNISADSEYVMTIPQWRFAVLKEMTPVIFFSAFTFLLLIFTFRYMLQTMRKQRLLDEIRTDFTNNITHELKTPIAVAYAANDSLLNFDSDDNTPRMNRYLKVCQEQLRLLDCLVEQILSISMRRTQSFIVNIEEIRVKEMIDSLVTNFRIKNDDVAFTICIDENLLLKSDRMHLANIISNLIDNAIKYSRTSPSIRVAGFINRQGQTVIEITDKGIGISNEQQKYIFDKFYRVPHGNIHDVKGYGLGLFYVKTMTERLGGSVTVKSAPGEGSRFTLKFNEVESEPNQP